MDYKDKVAFLASYISVMENSVNEKPQCVKFLTTPKTIDPQGFQSTFSKKYVFLKCRKKHDFS